MPSDKVEQVRLLSEAHAILVDEAAWLRRGTVMVREGAVSPDIVMVREGAVSPDIVMVREGAPSTACGAGREKDVVGLRR